MGQINGSDNADRRRERIFEMALRQLDERIDRLMAGAAEAFGEKELARSFREISEIRKELMTLDVQVDMADQAVARLERELAEPVPKEPSSQMEIHESEELRAILGGIQLRAELLEKALKDSALFGDEIGEIAEAIGSQSLKGASKEFFTGDEKISRYLKRLEIDPTNIEVRVFPLKTVYGPGPDFYLADRKTNRPVGIIDIKSTTRKERLNSAFQGSIDDVIRHLDRDKLTDYGDYYRLKMSDITYGLAVGIYFEPHRLNDPDYEVTYRMAVVKKVREATEEPETS